MSLARRVERAAVKLHDEGRRCSQRKKWENRKVNRDQAIAALKARERELRAAGVVSVSLFGSLARGETPANDVDLVVRLGAGFSERGLDYFSRMEELEKRLEGMLGAKVDVVEEPVRKERLQREIDRDRALAF